ncbi:hypothetical protein BN946_scf184999.g8 [Trametes cinnabarina]|uniref:Uncharacterized protein n=1 Tax=Pycnoporus cinnabarinus TaxID=5643 RepID=A0A060SDB2_PYCCI|nr:hypothetical protein BN946_scf184999.g8 [Trametes cinnabarina]
MLISADTVSSSRRSISQQTPTVLSSSFENTPFYLNHPEHASPPSAQMSYIIVANDSSETIYVMVSKYSTAPNGDDSWFPVASLSSDTWSREGWELVAFKNEQDSRRAGVYVPVDSTVTFVDFAHIDVKTE